MAVLPYMLVLATCLAAVQIVNSLDAGIIAYFEGGCPDGWSQYTNLNGRVTIAAGYYSGTREDSVSESKTFSYGESGGEMDHKLTTSEMPSHNHNNGDYKYVLRVTGSYTSDGQDSTSGEPDIKYAATMSNTGGSQTHNNLPPYYVLYACIKSENDDNYTLVTTFQTFKTNTNDDIYNIETSIDTINSNIDSIENNTNMLENSINNLESDIDSKIASLTKDINKLFNETDTIDTTIDVLENEIDIINEIVFRSIGNNDSIDFNAINETWTIAHDIDYIYDLISDLNDETSDLETKDRITDKNISNINNYINNLEKENEILKQNLTNLNERLDSLYEIVSQLTMTTTMDPNNEDNSNAQSNSSNDSDDTTITISSFIIILSCISFVLVCCLIAMCVLLIQAYKKHSKIVTNEINSSHKTNNVTHDDKGSMINEESATVNNRNNNLNNDNTENSVKELEMENVSHGDIGKNGQMNNKVISRTATDNLSVIYETANGNATPLGNENDAVVNMAINKSIEDAPKINKDNINITADNDASDSDVLFEGGPNTNDGITPAGERTSIVSQGL